MKKVLTILLCFVLCSFLVGAMELNPFGIAKEYKKDRMEVNNLLKEKFNEKYGVIELWDTSFWFKSNKIAEYSLTKNDEQCLINCEAEGEAILYREEKLFDNVLFKTEKNKNVNIEYKYFIKDKEEYEEEKPIYEEICSEEYNAKNKTKEERCRFEVKEIKTEKKIKEIWREYNGEVLPAGKYEWKIKGKKKPFSNIDFIPVKKNKEFSEWAWWSYNWSYKREISNITGYYSLIFINYTDKMNLDFSDIRFLDEDENEELLYWIEKKENGNYSLFRIKNKDNKKIYMYYGNSEATAPQTRIKDLYNNNLTAFYDFSSNESILEDKADGTNNGTIYGNPALIKGCKLGDCFLFDDIDDYIQGSDSVELRGKNLTILAWVYPLDTDSVNVIFNKGDIDTAQSYALVYTGDYNSAVSISSRTDANTWAILYSSPNGYFLNKWYQAGLILKPGANAYLYTIVNGRINTSSGSVGQASYNNMAPWNIGKFYNKNYYLKGYIDEIMIFTEALNSSFINDIYNISTDGFIFGDEKNTIKIEINLIQPDNEANYSNSVVFKCVANSTTEYKLKNLSLIIDNEINYSNIQEDYNLSIEKEVYLNEGRYNWSCVSSNTEGDIEYGEIRHINIDKTSPSINLANNVSIFLGIIPMNLSLTINVSDNLTGVKEKYYKIDNGDMYLFVNETINISINEEGEHTILIRAVDYAENIQEKTFNITLIPLLITNLTSSKNEYYETEKEEYIINISFNPYLLGETKAYLVFNNNNYYYKERTGEIGNYLFKWVFDTPIQNENIKINEAYVNFLINTSDGWVSFNTSKKYINTSKFYLNLCNATTTTKILNITTQDEKTKRFIDFYIKSNYIYYLGNGEITKNYTLTNLSLSSSVILCSSISNFDNINIISDIEIGSNQTYNNRKYGIKNQYSNITNNLELYLLDIFSSAPFTISFFKGIETYDNRYINILKYDYSKGEYILISAKKTDTSGKISEYLEIDNKYLFISEDGAIEKNSICESSPCSLSINFESGKSYLFNKIKEFWANNISSNLSYDHKEKKIKYLFVDLEGKATYFRLVVNKVSNKQEKEKICDKNLYGFVGILECDMNNYTGDFKAYGYVSKSPEKLDKSLSFVLDEEILKNKQRIVFFFFLISLFIIGGLIISGGSPFIPLLLFALSLLVTKITRLNPYSWFVNVSLIVIIMIILWRLEKN